MTPWLLVAGDFRPHGGMDCANQALASYLAQSGRRVGLVTHFAAADLAGHPNVRVYPVSRPLRSHFLGGWPLAWAGRRLGAAAVARGERVVVNGGNALGRDVNWVHCVHHAFAPPPQRFGLRWLKNRVSRPLNLHAERVALRAARFVVCNSEQTLRDVIELVGVHPDRTRVVYLACDTAAFRAAAEPEQRELRTQLGWPTDRPVVMFVGAVDDRRKGFDTLFEAWSRLARDPTWDSVLVVAGSGAEVPMWEGVARDGGFAHAIRFLGHRKDVPDLLRAADALVHPARCEAYGLAVHEALCCDIPAIVSHAAGIADRYPAELSDLLLADPNDAGELADRLRHWRADLEAIKARVRPFSDQLRAYTWDDMARAFLTAVGESP